MTSIRNHELPRQAFDEGAEARRVRERRERRERTDRLLLEISDDARRLKDRYLDDTVVPEGGE